MINDLLQRTSGWQPALFRLMTFFLLSAWAPYTPGAHNTSIHVGIFDNRPIVFQSSKDEYAGLSLDILESIAEQENWQIEYVYASWKNILQKLDDGKLDLVVGIAYSPERAQRYDFTRQTLINNWGMIVRGRGLPISSLSDLHNRRVALVSNSTHSLAFQNIMDQFGFRFETVEVPNYEAAMQAVQQGRSDAAVVNRVISLLHADRYSLLETGIIFNPVEVRYAALKGRSASILAAIDRHLANQKQDDSSVYYQSLDRWLHNDLEAELPPWLGYAVAVSALILILLAISNWLIRSKVAARSRELSESELRFRQLAENINEIFWIGTSDWQRVLYVSPVFESVFDMRREDLYDNGNLWLQAVHPDDLERVKMDMQKKLGTRFEETALPEFRIVTDTGIRWIRARAYPIRDENGRVMRIAGIAEDITEHKQAFETIDFMAHHDPLTRLHNRFAFEKQLDELIASTDWSHHGHVLMYIDLDQFKIINDTCGHAAGDQMLIELSRLLAKSIVDNAVLARLGGDEFGLILRNAHQHNGEAQAQRLLDAIADFRFEWDGQVFSVGASIGMVMINSSHIPRSDLLSAADMACYAAKERGRNRLHIYSSDDLGLLQRQGEMQWVNRLKNALEDDRFVLYCQSITPLQGDRGYRHREFLFRMLDEQGELVMPGQFIPAAERYELMPLLDRWVVSHVIAQLADPAWSRAASARSAITFINLSGQVFNDEHFADFIFDELEKHRIDPSRICMEITETAAIGNLDRAIDFIRQLRERGVHFALDDFGSGMSSFSYLKFLPVDFIKIDGVFIRELTENSMNAAIVEAITRIGHTAGLQVVAEWVEDTAVLQQLTDMGIDFAQGYAVDAPCPAERYN